MYPSDIHKALTLMNKYQPLKQDSPVVAAQSTAFVPGGKGGKGKKDTKKYLPEDEWNALTADKKSKLVKSQKNGGLENDDKSVLSAKLVKITKSLRKTIKKLKTEV